MSTFQPEYTINKVALILGVHRDTIMYWEERKLIPTPRRNPKSNYRVYSEAEVLEIARIRGIGVVDFEAIARDRERKKQEKVEK